MEIPISQTAEAALILRIKSGETNAYKFLYDANVTLLYRFLKQFRKNDSDVQELVQRSFIKAYDALSTFNGLSKFKTWLFQIALNELRSDARRKTILPFIDAEEIDEPNDYNEEEAIVWNTTLQTIFDQLDDTKRAVFILYEVEGYSHSEIAEMLKIGESTSRTILTRTKQWLRSQLKEQRG